MTSELLTRAESDAEIEIDPVCGATVDLDDAETRRVTVAYEGRDYAFCGVSCRDEFAHAPLRYAVAGRSRP